MWNDAPILNQGFYYIRLALRSRLFEYQVSAQVVHGCADLWAGASSFWYHMRDKSRKETSSKKSTNGPDKISVYNSDVKGPSKYSGPIKVLFHIPHHTFIDQRTWW
ncbi:uncharacterized protein TNCV_1424651 [Trichonephila clavipes]|nr:uncharacterized protein TNCV_1424651 [Trichonephila clavipes]